MSESFLPSTSKTSIKNAGPTTLTGQTFSGIGNLVKLLLQALCSFSNSSALFYTGSDGQRHYGIVTAKGLWPSPASESVDLSAYKLRFGDFVHALLSLTVFAVLGLLDTNIVQCFYPGFESSEKVLMQVIPPVIGAVASAVFVMFPSNRHGIGYPTSSDPNVTTQKST
ncbi:Protein DMP [Sesbania bispinosa]|nr:Protein DMP [Sesbania bispinosa]